MFISPSLHIHAYMLACEHMHAHTHTHTRTHTHTHIHSHSLSLLLPLLFRIRERMQTLNRDYLNFIYFFQRIAIYIAVSVSAVHKANHHTYTYIFSFFDFLPI